MKLGCLILNYNDSKRVVELVDILYNYNLFSKICIVDNNSNRDDFLYLSNIKYENVIILKSDKNSGFSGGNNLGLKYLQVFNLDYLCLINSDIFVKKNVLEELVYFLEDHSVVSIATCQMIEAGQKRQCHYDFPSITHYVNDNLGVNKLFKIKPKNVFKYDNYSIIDYSRSSLWMIRFKDFIDVDFFDSNTFLYHIETCVGLKLKQNNKKMALINNLTYDHNHIYKKGYKINAYKDSYKSLKYIFETYLKKNKFQMIIFSISYYAGLLLRKFLKIK